MVDVEAAVDAMSATERRIQAGAGEGQRGGSDTEHRDDGARGIRCSLAEGCVSRRKHTQACAVNTPTQS